jgi:hypothetical protein
LNALPETSTKTVRPALRPFHHVETIVERQVQDRLEYGRSLQQALIDRAQKSHDELHELSIPILGIDGWTYSPTRFIPDRR